MKAAEHLVIDTSSVVFICSHFNGAEAKEEQE
jgi:hypothetical protein